MSKEWTLKEVEQYSADNGIVLNATDRKRVTDAQATELERLQTLNPLTDETWSERFSRQYPKLLKAIAGVSSVMFTMMKTILTTIGLPFVLLLVAIVEVYRVKHGIDLFEVDGTLAMAGAIMLVLFNLVVEFTVHHVEHKAGYIADRKQKWSLAIWWGNMRYRLGFGNGDTDWQAQELSPAQGFRSILRLLTITILALALAGSMKPAIDGMSGEDAKAWHKAIGSILLESNLSDMTTWVGGFAFALTAVLGAQALTRYIAIQAVESEQQMEASLQTVDNPHADEIDRAGAMTMLAIVQAKIEKKKSKQDKIKAKEWGNPQDFLEPTIHLNGNGNHANGG